MARQHCRRASILAIQFLTAATPLAVVPFLSLHLQGLMRENASGATFWTAIAAAAPAVTAVILTPVWGRFAQERSISLLLSSTCAVTAASYWVMATTDDAAIFTLGRALQGAAGSGIILLLAVDHVGGRPEGEYIRLQQAFSAGCLVGPVIGGWAFDYQRLSVLLSAAGIVLIVLAIASSSIFRIAPAELRQNTQSQNESIGPTLAGIRPNRSLVIAATLGTAGAFGFTPFFAEWARERDAASFTAGVLGALHAAAWLAAIVVLPIWSRIIDGAAAAPSIALSLLGSAAACAALSVSATAPWIFTLRVTHGVFYSGLTPALYAGVRRSSARNRELATARTALTLGQIVGPALCGAVLPFTGIDGVLLAAAGLPAIGMLVLFSTRGDR
ncbi:MFS transporter [Methylocystis suflitae]|uniref:MFS transporter n=1 Tax=Methylocystis suflitae TaxID=2951405 RepID=UPI00210E7C33|nr:MFS transporter [Methylocystis suflitae]MCQ4189570.1 hypothetical protein [Methylocystis suflitae]